MHRSLFNQSQKSNKLHHPSVSLLYLRLHRQRWHIITWEVGLYHWIIHLYCWSVNSSLIHQVLAAVSRQRKCCINVLMIPSGTGGRYYKMHENIMGGFPLGSSISPCSTHGAEKITIFLTFYATVITYATTVNAKEREIKDLLAWRHLHLMCYYHRTECALGPECRLYINDRRHSQHI